MFVGDHTTALTSLAGAAAVVQGATKIVKVIIEHPNYMAGEETIKRRTTENDPFFRTEEKSQFHTTGGEVCCCFIQSHSPGVSTADEV